MFSQFCVSVLFDFNTTGLMSVVLSPLSCLYMLGASKCQRTIGCSDFLIQSISSFVKSVVMAAD